MKEMDGGEERLRSPQGGHGKEGFNFYKEIANQIGPPEAQKIFLSLAQDEIQHLLWLEAQEESWLKKGEWLTCEPPPQKARAAEGLPIFSS
jgi:rubrerythrin